MTKDVIEKHKYRLNSLYFYLTGGCNLRCSHCWISPKYQVSEGAFPALDFALFRSIVEQARPLGLASVKLTGGEPLLHPDIIEILKYLHADGFRLSIETNGLLCTPELSHEIAAGKEVFVAVSIDGADAKTHEGIRGVKGSFEAAKRGIKNLAEAGLRPQVIMTIMRQNKEHMESVLHLAESLGAGSVKFNLLQPTARGEEMHKAGKALSIKELVSLGAWAENVLSPSTDLHIFYSHPMAFRPLGKIFERNEDGCGACDILGILGVLADGLYALCGIGEAIPELVFGCAATDRLEDVWNNTPVLQQLRAGFPSRLEGICGECIMRDICLGSCIAQNYCRSKSLWAPHWYCDEAYNYGFFPETRVVPKVEGSMKILLKNSG